MKQLYCFHTDPHLRITEWDDDIATFTGKPQGSVMGKKYYEALPRIVIERRDAVALAAKQKKEIVLDGYGFACLHGTISADIRISPRTGPGGGSGGVEVAFTPRATCLMAIKFQNLQRLIDIGKTASTLAHGVRNPLNAIKGAVVHLRQKYNDEPTLIEFTKIMEDEIQRLDHFISRFLSAASARREPVETDLNALLRRLELFTSLQARASSIETAFTYGEVPPLRIDAFQLEQAILNIINNAIEAMPTGGRLTVGTDLQERFGGGVAVVEIADSGPGMGESGISGLTAPLGEGGRGFGLFIAREIVQYYNGHLEIVSTKDRGTTVRLYLPATVSGGSA